MRFITISVYLLCGIASVAIIWWSYRHPEKVARPAGVLDYIMESRSARIALIVFWWWIGWHFLFAQTVDP